MRAPKRAFSYPKPGTYSQVNGGVEGALTEKRKKPRKSGKKAEIGSANSFRRLLEQEAWLYERMTESEANQEAVLAASYREQWTKLATAIGTSETRDIKNQLHKGELVARTIINKQFASLLGHLPETLRSGMKNMRAEVAPGTKVELWESKIDALMDRFFASLPDLLIAEARKAK